MKQSRKSQEQLNREYREKHKEIRVFVQHEDYQRICIAAAKAAEKPTAYVKKAIFMRLEADEGKAES